MTVTDPEVTRFFMTIPEACRLVLEAATMGKGGEIYVFDMGEPVRIADLAEKMIRLSGLEPGVDIDIVYTGLRPGEKLYEELLATTENTLAYAPSAHPHRHRCAADDPATVLREVTVSDRKGTRCRRTGAPYESSWYRSTAAITRCTVISTPHRRRRSSGN